MVHGASGQPASGGDIQIRNLSAVIGLRLADGREVVVKVRPDSPRIAARVEVQRRMFVAGYPGPQPLTGTTAFGADAAAADAYVPGGAMLPSAAYADRHADNGGAVGVKPTGEDALHLRRGRGR
ncbi:hypothetical protein GCM10027569_01350 [Flindersiella endophytica]